MRFVRSVLLGGASVALAATSSAQVPAGGAFRVNTYTTGGQDFPAVAMRPQGDFLVVWNHQRQDMHARWYAASGVAIGEEFLVNAYTTTAQFAFRAGIGLDARGNAIVPWADLRNQGTVDVFARRVSAAGAPVGDDFQVNETRALDGGAAVAPDGRFVVAWRGYIQQGDIFARRFDPFGTPMGAPFQVNTYTPYNQVNSDVAMDAAGNFTVVWHSYRQDEPVDLRTGVYGQRFDASGARLGVEFQVNSFSPGWQANPAIAMDRDGAFIVTWEGAGPGSSINDSWIWARRYSNSGAPLDIEFALTTVPTGVGDHRASIAFDEAGNFVVAWKRTDDGPPSASALWVRRFSADGLPRGAETQVAGLSPSYILTDLASDATGNFIVVWDAAGADGREVFAQRYGGLLPAGLALADGGNGVLEVADNFVLGTSWRNFTGAAQTFQGRSSNVNAPAGLVLTLTANANYGTVPDGGVGTCSGPCIAGGLTGTRPTGHVDLTFVETIQPDVQGQAKLWALHVGDSFTDVPRTSPFYRFIETLLHQGVTVGCVASNYCPASFTTREQMAPLVLTAKEGSSYTPPDCTTPPFGDVPASSPFCRWIEELARRGVVSGCGAGNYCPGDPMSREQTAVFVLRTLDPALNPPACTTPVFADVPASSPFCRWIEELARRGVVTGCGGGNYCPTAPVTREQMSVFLTVTFGLTLYGP